MEPFLGEIRIVAFTFPPKGWAVCNGQLMSIRQYSALFSLLGTTYGGDGTTNFALPNFQGRTVMAPGQGPGLSNRQLGEAGGETTVTLTAAQMPGHTHGFMAVPDRAGLKAPGPTRALARSDGGNLYQPASSPTGLQPMADQAIAPTGGSQAHNNLQPYVTLLFVIAVEGIFPTRS